MWTDSQGMQPNDEPRALETSEIPGVIAEYVQATHNAMAAGFDGVELHAASGYLPNQFLSETANQRNDEYGGSIENRIRFVVETLAAMMVAAGSPGKVGIKVSPGMKFNDIRDDDPLPTYLALVEAIAPLKLAYLHVMRAGIGAEVALRQAYPVRFLSAAGSGRKRPTRRLKKAAPTPSYSVPPSSPMQIW
jgi:N-ethylmaleimide reductase